MDFRLLGPLEVTRDGRVLQLGRAKERALLAVLLLHANQVVSSDVLTDRLWGDEPPATAGKALQVYVSRLRKALGADALVTRAPGYFVSVAPGQLDLHRFEELVTQAQGAEPATASGPLTRSALDVEGRTARRLRIRDVRTGRDRSLGGAPARRHRAAHRGGHRARAPVRARGRGRAPRDRAPATRTTARSADARPVPVGTPVEALAVYQDGRSRLDDELGLEPSESLKRLQRQILAHDPALEPRSVAEHVVRAASVRHSILVLARNLDGVDALLGLAGALARAEPSRALILVHLAPMDALGHATSALHEHRAKLLSTGLAARAAAFFVTDSER